MGLGISTNRAELRVELGKTSFEELQKFNQEAAQNGGGEVRAKKNDDGSFTLYVPSSRKFSLRSIFGESWGATARQEKRNLGADLVKDILSRRLPAARGEGADPGAEILRHMATPGRVSLGGLLNSAKRVGGENLSPEARQHYQSLDAIIDTPELAEVFGEFLDEAHARENLDFLQLERQFAKAKSPQEKLALAEKMMEMVEAPGGGQIGFDVDLDAEGPTKVNLSDHLNQHLHAEIAYLRQAVVTGQEPAPADLARLNNLFENAVVEVRGMLTPPGILNRFIGTEKFEDAAGAAFAKAGMRLPGSNSASILRPGSGAEFLEARAQLIAENPDHPSPDQTVAERLFQQQMDVRPDSLPHESGWDRFEGVALSGSGGATGSGQGKVGKQLYQVKGSIEHAGFMRRMKAGGLNTENYGEVIASNISRALVGPVNQGQIPKVALRQNLGQHEAMVTSEYLKGGKGDLKALYMEKAGPLPPGQRHPKIELDSPGLSGDGVLRLSGTASRDVQRNIALSALMGDHDVNPGNMIALSDGHVGRIDFGHAFNELINGPGGSWFGGGVQFSGNRVLDFFNRESISGVPFTGQQTPKLWRDYIGAGPSEGMTAALREIGQSQTQLEGIQLAKSQFSNLITALEAEGTPEARAQIEDLTNSLKRISQNIGVPVTTDVPGEAVDQVFANITNFIQSGQRQMLEVANLSELQTMIDAFIEENPDPTAPIPENIQAAYNILLDSTVAAEGNEALTWMKMSRETPAFQGNLEAYIQMRRDG